MSLIITLYLGEGIVMASDSRITLEQTTKDANGNLIVNKGIHYSDSSYKTFLSAKGVGLSTCGQASVAGKPIAGFIDDFLNLNEKSDVQQIANNISPYFRALDPNIDTNFIIGGYIEDNITHEYKQKVYKVNTQNNITNEIDTSSQGAIWDGQIDILSRLLTPVYQNNGDGYFELPKVSIPFQYFTLQDAIDFAKYAIQTTIDSMKFQERIKSVGGPIDILIIKPTNSFWITRKELHK